MCLYRFSYMGNPMPYSVLKSNVKKLLETRFIAKMVVFKVE